MPWKVTNPMMERMKFLARLAGGERMTDLCDEFHISRTTGYKLQDRFGELGVEAARDLSRRPWINPKKTPDEILDLIYERKRKRPTWGPGKLRDELARAHPGVKFPCVAVIHKWLNRKGLVRKRKARRKAAPTPPSDLGRSVAPNDIWCIDYKGEFRLGNREYCYPITITDHFSRFLLACEGMERIKASEAKAVCREVFRKFGLPNIIRSDNGSPFASTGLLGLSSLSVWWMRLGIKLERIEPGHPEQNGRHERMHLTLKEDTTRPPEQDMLRQQQRFDDFRQMFNTERPHQSLGMKRPAELYEKSCRPFPEKLEPLEYPLHDDVRTVKKSGHIHLWKRNQTCYISQALAYERVGLRELDLDHWLVTFMDLDLGIIDTKTRRLEASSEVGRKRSSLPGGET